MYSPRAIAEQLIELAEALTGGTCYEDAGRMIMDEKVKNAVLVHGRPTLKTSPYTEFGHAWIEDDDVVIDPSVDVVMRRERYYEIGKIDYRKNLVYDRDSALKWMLVTGHFGPWEGPDAVSLTAKQMKNKPTGGKSSRKP